MIHANIVTEQRQIIARHDFQRDYNKQDDHQLSDLDR